MGTLRLSDDREAIEDFKAALENLASNIPQMDSEDRLNERLETAVNDVLKKWERDRANMSAIAKEIFGVEAVKPAGELVQKIFEKALGPAIGAGAALEGYGLAAGALVGIVVHGITSWGRVARRQREGAFRYLTAVERSRVTFTLGAS
jgi:hypothetical protein